ncbi:hypothetical protein TNIN_438701 [Trichonephila inaurata madagascariensis]|uniref:Uncharacterized protein n=1 Tax=Trichonephila inaurata madagascariensis TaxID=2747483 RepID=A0A8X6XRX3_9ARAC|nr:hypothetical protein TNIN_438701 [Trichonephila inaurata madagascariensis]
MSCPNLSSKFIIYHNHQLFQTHLAQNLTEPPSKIFELLPGLQWLYKKEYDTEKKSSPMTNELDSKKKNVVYVFNAGLWNEKPFLSLKSCREEDLDQTFAEQK